jgi:formate C-acetyltransferase
MSTLKPGGMAAKTARDSYVSDALETLFSIRPTSRVNRLREACLSIQPSHSLERARIEAKVMRATEGEPVITRRAKVLAAALREMPIAIYPDELIVGQTGVSPYSSNVVPGLFHPTEEERSGGSGYIDRSGNGGLSADDLKELNEDLTPYWKQQGRVGRIAGSHYGHNIHGMHKVVLKGFLGIKKEAEDRLARLDLTNPDDIKKIPFLKGVVTVMESAVEYGQRYAALAREMAAKEKDAARKSELLKLAEVCDRVPAHPARTFYEALQSYHFAWLMLSLELYHDIAFALGRMDQYLYPYYEKDIKDGRISREEAQELLDCYIIKLNHSGSKMRTISGSIGIGGYKTDGNDATNDLSYMFIESMLHVRLADPWFAVHIHSKTPNELLIRSTQLCSLGTGHPQFLNSDVGVAQMLARGNLGGAPVSLEDARMASNVGCLELVVPGKDSGYLYIAMHNLALALELALNNGRSRIDGRKIGAETGDPRKFTTVEDVQEAFRKQVEFMRINTQISGIEWEKILIDMCPTVYESAIIDDCIEKGLCREEGGARYNNNTGGTEVGSSDAADSLAAIKKLVFDEKKITITQLCDALDHNFQGFDAIRRMCLAAPKFGNDIDLVDEQKAWVEHQWASEFVKLTNLRGGHGCPGGSSETSYIPMGKIVGALPSGRLAGEPLAPAASPCAGKDTSGVTSVLKSMGKVDGTEILAGLSLTCRLDPGVFNGEDGYQRLADLLRVFVDQKVFHLQINVVDSETLKDAQKKPENYKDLMVKVAGHNAYFTSLTKELQNSIIARTEHGL